jgi:hypothetical protein
MYRMQATLLRARPQAVGNALGWEFDGCVELTAHGHRLVAFVTEEPGHDSDGVQWLPEPAVALAGVVLIGSGSAQRLVAAASEFAGYCARAVLIPTDAVRPEVLALAAMVDVGVVADGAAPRVLCPAGTRMPGAVFSVSEWELRDQVHRALASSGAGLGPSSPA